MGIEKKPQMEAEEAFKLDVVRVKLVKEAPLYSELPLQNPYEAAATIGELLCEMYREVVCVVNLQSDLKPINVTFASIGALNEALVHPREILKASIKGGLIMILSSSDGTKITIEEMEKSWRTLHECYLRISEINEGTYTRNEPIQFDYCTCPELANWTDSLKEVIGKIEKVVYQK